MRPRLHRPDPLRRAPSNGAVIAMLLGCLLLLLVLPMQVRAERHARHDLCAGIGILKLAQRVTDVIQQLVIFAAWLHNAVRVAHGQVHVDVTFLTARKGFCPRPVKIELRA